MGLGRRTRVLFYAPELELGGAERKIGRLAAGLDRARFECIVGWSHCWGPVGDKLFEAGIPVHRIALSDDFPGDASHQISDIQPDVFHSFSYHHHSLDVLAAKRAGVQVIVTSRVNTREWDPHLTVQDWELVRNGLTDWVTAVSDAAANLAVKVERLPQERITVIRNGVEIPDTTAAAPSFRKKLNLGQAVPLVGCVANYREEKGHELLLRAFRLVLDLRPHAHLVCCGLDNGGGLKAGLQNLVVSLGMERSVTLLESQTDVDPVYRALDVYVQPSLFEGFSNAILEAMANALPVVATEVGGNPEAVVRGITGLLAPCDPVQLADCIVSLLDDPERARDMGRSGLERCRERFQATRMVSAHERLYVDLMARASRTEPGTDRHGTREAYVGLGDH